MGEAILPESSGTLVLDYALVFPRVLYLNSHLLGGSVFYWLIAWVPESVCLDLNPKLLAVGFPQLSMESWSCLYSTWLSEK